MKQKPTYEELEKEIELWIARTFSLLRLVPDSAPCGSIQKEATAGLEWIQETKTVIQKQAELIELYEARETEAKENFETVKQFAIDQSHQIDALKAKLKNQPLRNHRKSLNEKS